MTPIFRREVFSLLVDALQEIPESRLGSDSGLEMLWCGLSVMHYPDHPPCVAVSHVSVIHLNTRTIHKYDKEERQHYFNPNVNLLPYLVEHFAPPLRAICRSMSQ